MSRGRAGEASLLRVASVYVVLAAGVVLAEFEAADWNDPNIVYDKTGNEGKWVKHPGMYAPGAFKPGIMQPDGTVAYGSYSAGTTFGTHTPPPINVDHEWARRHGSITVLIASFRETRCPQTLKSMFSKANHSERIYFGVIQQNADDDVDCLQGYCKLMGTPVTDAQIANNDPGDCALFKQVRMVRMHDYEAKGPVFARSRQIETIRDEDDFCMQIDAHTDVVQGWDDAMVEEWLSTGNEYAVLTTYPTNVDHIGQNVNKHWEMPHLCKASFSGKGRIHNEQALAAAGLEYPLLSPLWAAGLSFARCHAERNVPTDPVLKSTFTGEEYARGSRLWTAGYDFYSITRPILGTYYGGQKGGKGSFKHDTTEFNVANERMATLLKWPGSDQSDATLKDMGIYGIGTKRSLEQYAEFSGVDTIHQKSAGRCIVQYVPWDWAHPMVPEELDNAWDHEDKKKQPPAHKAVDPDDIHDNIHNIDPKQHAAIKEAEARESRDEVAAARQLEPEPEHEHRREINKVDSRKGAVVAVALEPYKQEVEAEAFPEDGVEDGVEGEGRVAASGWTMLQLLLTIVTFYAGLTVSKTVVESMQKGPKKSRHLIA